MIDCERLVINKCYLVVDEDASQKDQYSTAQHGCLRKHTHLLHTCYTTFHTANTHRFHHHYTLLTYTCCTLNTHYTLLIHNCYTPVKHLLHTNAHLTVMHLIDKNSLLIHTCYAHNKHWHRQSHWDTTCPPPGWGQHTPHKGVCCVPLLYTLYTTDCGCAHSSNTMVKFADDTTAVGLITGGGGTSLPTGTKSWKSSWTSGNTGQIHLPSTYTATAWGGSTPSPPWAPWSPITFGGP